MVDANIAGIFREVVKTCVRKLGLLQKADASCCGITVAQCHTLVEIGKSNCLSLNELSELLTLDKSTMSRTVDNLVNAGLVTRQSDTEDRRYMKITLTAKGSEMVEIINNSMEKYYERVLNAVPEEKHALVMEALPYLLTAVKDTDMSFGERQMCPGLYEHKEEGVKMSETIREAVRKRYAKAITGRTGCCGGAGSSCCDTSLSKATQKITGNLYSETEVQGLPADLVATSFGCGNPTALAELYPGEIVLDLGIII